MKIIKKVLIAILAIVALILIIAAFTPNEYRVEREVSINKTKAFVYDYTKYLKNQQNFSVWANMDPNSKLSFTGVDGTVGFVSAWDSQVKEVGKGEQEITKMVEGERIDYELRFLWPMEMTDQAYMTFKSETDNQTKVLWGFYGEMVYPSNLMLLIMDMDDMLGPDLEQGLVNLKGILEKMPEAVKKDQEKVTPDM